MHALQNFLHSTLHLHHFVKPELVTARQNATLIYLI